MCQQLYSHMVNSSIHVNFTSRDKLSLSIGTSAVHVSAIKIAILEAFLMTTRGKGCGLSPWFLKTISYLASVACHEHVCVYSP